MTFSVEIDDQLVQRGLELGGEQSKDALLSDALREYVDKRARQKVIEAFGTVDYYQDYDPKAHR